MTLWLLQISLTLTSSLVSRVVREFRNSPQLALEFYNWVRTNQSCCPQFLDSSCTLIHVLINSRRYDDALSLMESLMGEEGLPPLVVLEGLVTSYDEGCGFSSPAVFDALVRACTRLGATDGAYEVIKKLRLDGYWVSIHAWNNFLNHVIKLNEIDRFWKMYKEMLSYGYVENVNTFYLVMYALCKECKLLEAMSGYYRMLKSGIWPSVVTFNMIIDGACRMGDMELALKVLRKIGVMSEDCVTPNSVTYNCIINGFCKIGGLSVAEEIRGEMTEPGVEANLRTYATLVDGYAKQGSLEVALQLCDEMVEGGLTLNPVVYNSIIHRLYIEGDTEEALSLLSDMIDRHIFPDQFTYSILIKGLCRSGLLTEAIRFHNHILEKNLVKDVFSHNILNPKLCRSTQSDHLHRQNEETQCAVSMVAAADDHLQNDSDSEDGDQVQKHEDQNNQAPDAQDDHYCSDEKGSIGSAVQIYEKLIEGKKKPNLVIYNSVINGLCKEASVDVAKLLMDSLQRMDVLDIVTYNTMINGYFISGMIDQAFVLLQEMEEGGISFNIVTYNILINFLCKFGCIQQAKGLMKVMISRGMVPDFVTYTTLITNLNKSCSTEEVVALHDYMVTKGVIPDRQTYKDIVCPYLLEENS
ncbi:pentatricopeptide repeat-containing protein At1g11710, mitochondrial-like [Pyrus x bretschneideri]|uniref:pentatricopeptide repeat-containing protein At1g11710, mitochondrial-like n=1 Tax=Pyrus x bretschneideri TaxID=225117 RepID=UPI00202EC2C1|nr:pentatricopeptide repeat-containing protein At1g11710, mitochondrial-like [Pyrus x bretschneideri]